MFAAVCVFVVVLSVVYMWARMYLNNTCYEYVPTALDHVHAYGHHHSVPKCATFWQHGYGSDYLMGGYNRTGLPRMRSTRVYVRNPHNTYIPRGWVSEDWATPTHTKVYTRIAR